MIDIRTEYVVIGFILVLIVLLVSLSMLSGVAPSIEKALDFVQGK